MSENKEIIEDYLKVDKELPGQNYVCLSFISPETNKIVFPKLLVLFPTLLYHHLKFLSAWGNV